jgi:hypothetical protein
MRGGEFLVDALVEWFFAEDEAVKGTRQREGPDQRRSEDFPFDLGGDLAPLTRSVASFYV